MQEFYSTLFKDSIISIFGDEYGEIAATSWKMGIKLHNELLPYLTSKGGQRKKIALYTGKIRDFDSNYKPPIAISAGCYVATAVYGSYDCPEVWTLRRFRDYELAKTWYGRAFVRVYYAVSPTLVKWFGNTDWFKNIWRGRLDAMVASLQKKGYESAPYKDKEW